MKWYKIVLISLITSTPIIGVSYFDDKIWRLIVAILGSFTYACVRGLYKLGAINSRSEGSDANLIIFIVSIVTVFLGIQCIMNWINSWSLITKIIVPSVICIGIIGIIIYSIYEYLKYGDNYCN